MRGTKGAACLVACALLCAALTGCEAEEEASWGESAEFSQLMTGQTRFSAHDTNLSGWGIIVDHQTGVQYLAYEHYKRGAAVCPLLDADGKPLRVLEAGDE